MALTRSAATLASAAVLAAASVAAIGYRVWRDFYQPAASSAPATPGASASGRSAGVKPAAAAVASRRVEASKRVAIAAPSPPSFDVVRVEPSGDAVVAGRAAPHAVVRLLDNGTQIGDPATADADGAFALLPPKLAKGDHELSLEMGLGGLVTRSKETVTVVVPETAKGRLVVALASPGEPTRVLADSSAPAKAPAPAPVKTAAAPQVHIQTVEVGQGGGFFASGSAPSGAPLRLYLNDAPVAVATADKEGHWSLRVKKGLKPGDYAVRADALDAASGEVVARAQAPFKFNGFALSEPRKEAVAAAAQAGPGGAPADAVVADLPTVRVVRGDSLWEISRHIFGRGIRYTLIYDANADQIRNRNLIYPGQIFVVPKS